MLTIGARLRKWTLFLLVCGPPTLAQPANETSVAIPSADTSVVSSSTSSKLSSVTPSPPKSSTTSLSDTFCPFRTINYITHTLPQQCLRTSWSNATQAPTVSGAEAGREATPTPSVAFAEIREETERHKAGTGQDDGHVVKAQSEGVTESLEATGSASSTSTQPEPEVETDSPLDNANFLSFEDWKKKNLARAGQSPENIGQGRASSSDTKARRRPVDINALDALGEEAEIEIDFSGFGNVVEGDNGAIPAASTVLEGADSTKSQDDEDKVAPTSFALSKDAGKTCKERFNYASFDCAATVLKTNSKAKSTSAVLVENKDSYMLNECAADNKFVIVELCDDILVDTVVLANYEFFSSMFRHFRVSVSDRYPVKMDRWRTLGTFEARNSRDIQPFLIKEPQIWARYLRIEFMTHYGNEFYCPMSLIRVHGTTMMEQFRREEEEARGDDDFVEPIEALEGDPVKTAVPVAEDADVVSTEKSPHDTEKSEENELEGQVVVENVTDRTASLDTPSQINGTDTQAIDDGQASTQPVDTSPSRDSTDAITATSVQPVTPSTSSVTSSPHPEDTSVTTHKDKGKATRTSTAIDSMEPASLSAKASSEPKTAGTSAPSNRESKTIPKAPTNETASVPTGTATIKAPVNSTANSASSQSQQRASSQTVPGPATPSTQESFFKSIHKRLQHLEANSTLSLQYIEEQSRILRDAFVKVEKRQLSKTERFLDHLNNTVVQELKSYRSMYDQLWQSTILELEGMKERQKAEIGEIGARLSLVADELVWQKRMAVVQSTLLLLCLGLVLFVRSGTLGSGHQSDVPIVQQLGSKYSRFWESPPGSPNPPGGGGVARRSRTLRSMWRSDTSAGLSDGGINATSDAETDGGGGGGDHRSTTDGPTTPSAASDLGHETGDSPPRVAAGVEDTPGTPDSQARRIHFLATQSGPATPRGSRDSRPSWEEVDRAVEVLNAEVGGEVKGAGDGDGDGDGNRAQRSLSVGHTKGSRKESKRSPLRRAESYTGVTGVDGDDANDIDNDYSPGEDSLDGLTV